jgi:hypothetical protein
MILILLVGTLVVVGALRSSATPETTARISGRLALEGQPLARHTVIFIEPTPGGPGLCRD